MSAGRFYEIGALVNGVLCVGAIGVALQCPYSHNGICPGVFYVLVAVAALGGMLSPIMLQIAWALQHVRTLGESDLTPHKQNASTRRWGISARRFPGVSRFLFVSIGAVAVTGIVVGQRTCHGSVLQEQSCGAPISVAANPVKEFGIGLVMWLLLAFAGSRTRESQKLPFLYEPLPADESQLEVRRCGGVCLLLTKAAKVVHP